MTLADWKDKEKLSNAALGRVLGMNRIRVFRICQQKDVIIRLDEAKQIVDRTQNEVSYEDLLGC